MIISCLGGWERTSGLHGCPLHGPWMQIRPKKNKTKKKLKKKRISRPTEAGAKHDFLVAAFFQIYCLLSTNRVATAPLTQFFLIHY